jgi:hypothetical protein
MVSQYHLPQNLDSGGLLFYLYGFSTPSPPNSRQWWPTILLVWFLNTISLRIWTVVSHYSTCMVSQNHFPWGQIVMIYHFTYMVSLYHISKTDGDYPPYSLG